MSDDQFDAGDVVVLKSGGPTMTIEKIATYNGLKKAECVWFLDGVFASQVVALSALEKA